MDQSDKSGIYLFINISEAKYIIGSTWKFSQRKEFYYKHFQEQFYYNFHLKRLHLAYGDKDFLFLKLLDVPSIYLEPVEQQIIDKYYNSPHCINISPKSSPGNRMSLTEDQIKTIEDHPYKINWKFVDNRIKAVESGIFSDLV